MKAKKTVQKPATTTLKKSKNTTRTIGTPYTKVDRKLGKYLQSRGLPALAQILKIDK